MKTSTAKKTFVLISVIMVLGASGSIRAQDINLTGARPWVPQGISFRSSGAEYDFQYQHHWRITSLNGFVSVGFEGPSDVAFRALGSTINGVSYCRINVIVNGNLYWRNMFVNKDWNEYVIPASVFGRGPNEVTIQLVGRTHLWIQDISLRRGGERDREPALRREPMPPSRRRGGFFH